MTPWPRPEILVPPRWLDALATALAGDAAGAAAACAAADARDSLAGPVVRLVRALAAQERGERARAGAELRLLSRHADAGVALVAAAARLEACVAARRFAAAAPIVAHARRRARDAATRLWIDALALRVELARRGGVPRERVDALAARLLRAHPACVHAAVHVLRSERALLADDLSEAVAAHREARPWVRTCGHATLVRRQDDMSRLLRAPWVDVEDWEEPLRTVSREELAAIEARPWQVWLDALHRRVAHRGRQGRRTLSFARLPELWSVLELVARAPSQRLGWGSATAALGTANVDATRERVRRLAAELRGIGVGMTLDDIGFGLRPVRFVSAFAHAALPVASLRLLAMLAAQPGARAAELARGDGARRTIVSRLARLRRDGYVRMVGGGAEARYTLV
jgi:hypothetical protein